MSVWQYNLIMETFKKALLIFLGVSVILGSILGGFYFFKKKFSITQPSQPHTGEGLPVPGLTKDLTNKIPDVFPEGLLISSNIKNTIESFTVEGEKTQYTFRYISTGNFIATQKYFFDKVKNGFKGWYINSISGNSTSYFLKLKGPKNQDMFITITTVRADIVVDVTLIK